jgi:hypothetical protein
MIPFDYRPGVFQIKMWDVLQMSIFPTNWVDEILETTKRYAELCILDGRSSTSREGEDVKPMKICVVTGNIVRRELPWLYDAYRGPLKYLAQQLIGKEIETGNDLNSSININLLEGQGDRYERHVDSNPVTGLLFVTTLKEEHGGALVFEHSGTSSDLIYPRSGLFIAFDALQTTHYVAPLLQPCSRITVPMNYFIAGTDQTRPGDLDSYLYGGPNEEKNPGT